MRQPGTEYRAYIRSSHFWEATTENWESEFLQIFSFGWLMNLLAEPWPPATLGAPRMEGSPAPSEEPV